MKIHVDLFQKKIKPIRDTEVYSVHDLLYLKNINVSMTILHPGKATAGHEHEKEEEVYVFFSGKGNMQLGKKKFKVGKGDIILVKSRQFHKTFNNGKKDLIFICIFQKYLGRGK
jgi:mannose-6-phosphate isomerase-like protein (cupin superfamily)